MKPELALLKLFLNRDYFLKYGTSLTEKQFPNELSIIYNCIVNYYRDSVDNLSVADLSLLVFSSQVKDKAFYEGVLENLDCLEVNENIATTYVQTLKRNLLLQELSIASYECASGNADYNRVATLIQNILDDGPDKSGQETFVSDDLVQIVKEVEQQPGLSWRLASLNKSLGNLRKGTLGVVQARPETGKTSFLASEVSYMAGQTNQPILWFNNEQEGTTVQLYAYRAALGRPLIDLYASPAKYKEEYLKATKGNIKIYDDANLSKTTVENLCKKYTPALIVIDQIDKVKGFKADREDLLLGAIYQWARELAKQWCPVIGVCQSGASGENKKWLTMDDMSNSKTSKGAEADFILGIGKINDPGWESIRFMHLSKNKLAGDPQQDPSMRHGFWETILEQEIARYKDI